MAGKMTNTDEYIEIAGAKWELAITRTMSLWHQERSSLCYVKNLQDWGLDASLRQLSLVRDGCLTNCFYQVDDFRDFSAKVLEIMQSGEKLDLFEKNCKKYAKDLLKSLDDCLADLNPSTWKKFIESYSRFACSLQITACMGKIGGEMLPTKLRESGISEDEIAKMIEIVTYPEEHTPLFESQLGILKIGAAVQAGDSDVKLKKMRQDWMKRFASIPVNFCGEPWTRADLEKKIDDVLNLNCENELKRLDSQHREKIVLSAKKKEKIGNNKVVQFANAIAKGTILNEFRKNIFCQVSLKYRPIFEVIAKRAGSANWRDCFYLLNSEFEAIISGSKVPLAEIAEQRKTHSIHASADGEIITLNQAEMEKLVDYTARKQGWSGTAESDETEVVKGFRASSGIVRGIARVVLSPADFPKVKRGDILVTVMTSVDYVPIMEKAAAFVTNEGGITSHASIVAREMGKPCIIGTKNATKAIKDGDMIEVDANEGIVRKIL